MLRGPNGTDLCCCMKATQGESKVKNALERALAFSPYLKLQLANFPVVAQALGEGNAEKAIELARSAGADAPNLASSLRRGRNALSAALAVADLAAAITLERLMEELSDLADSSLERALAEAIAERTPDDQPRGFAIVALGKHGSRELNYSSDVDLLFLFDPKTLPLKPREEPGQGALRIGQRLIELIQKRDGDGFAFR